ncbi:MAG TPA: tetratricopeptide repeat protein [Pyrinomonadaceae bacterium]|nr:tetratricopeptide repeat protein [Pyrinomonadaceae bacterium]
MSRETVLSSFTLSGRIARVVMVLMLVAFSLSAVAAQDSDDADDAVAIFNEAQALHEKGKLAEAIALYEKAINALPEFPEAEYQRASALQSLGKNDEAEKGFRRAVELKPDWTLAMTSLGSLLVKRGNFAEAEPILIKALETEPQNPTALTALVELRLTTKASKTVLQDLLTKVSSLTSKANPTAALWLAKAALESALGKLEQAKASLTNTLSLDPNNRSAMFQLADIALVEGDLQRANSLAAVLERSGQNKDELYLLRANILAGEGKFEDALKQLDAITKPTAVALSLRSQIVANSSQNPADLEKQLETDAMNVQLLGRLCNLYRKDDPQKALAYCRRANAIEPTNVSHAVGYGAALVQAKQYDAAVNLLRNILQKVPDNRTAHANLATALFQLDRYAEAKPEFEWLTAKEPTLAGPYYFLAIAHDHLAEYMDAMANYQSYLRLADPVANKLDIEKINLRLPQLQKLIKEGKGKKN